MLQNTEKTLTNSQISEFILDREYTNYFHLQQAISELVEAELITMDTRSNVSHYRITEDGIKTLSFFQKDLSPYKLSGTSQTGYGYTPHHRRRPQRSADRTTVGKP